jgi:nitrous oxidase accessory protein
MIGHFRLALLMLFILVGVSGSARVVHVGVDQAIVTIREAIQSAHAFDTIYVHKGLYKEGNLIIENPLFIIGEPGAILDGEDKYEILTIHAQAGLIRNLTFQHTGVASINDLAAVKILDSSGLRIENNRFLNCFFGVYLSNSTNIHITKNDLQANAEADHQIGNGIHLWKCAHITVDNNVIKGHRDGIYFEFVTYSLITNNHSEENMRYGLHFMFSHNDEYRNNVFFNNGAGVAVMYTKEVKMIGNHFKHNWGSSAYGLLLKDIRDSEISNNEFTQNTVGIYMEGSSRNKINRNQFESNGYAIRLQASCDENDLSSNNFQQNTFDVVTNGSLVLNRLQGNYWDRYDGYDMNHDQVGDVPYHPVSLYGTLVERMPAAVLLWRSFFVFLLDRAERAIPAITPENLKDPQPAMTPYAFDSTRL